MHGIYPHDFNIRRNLIFNDVFQGGNHIIELQMRAGVSKIKMNSLVAPNIFRALRDSSWRSIIPSVPELPVVITTAAI